MMMTLEHQNEEKEKEDGVYVYYMRMCSTQEISKAIR